MYCRRCPCHKRIRRRLAGQYTLLEQQHESRFENQIENYPLLLTLFQLVRMFRHHSVVTRRYSYLYGLRYVECPSSFTRHGPFSVNEQRMNSTSHHTAAHLGREQSQRSIPGHHSTFHVGRSDSTFALAHTVTPLPKCEWGSLGRVTSLEEPEPLSHCSVSTLPTSPYRTYHRHIRPHVDIARILGDTGGCLADTRICNIAEIRVTVDLGAIYGASRS